MPYHAMTDEQIRTFLTAVPPHTGKLATVRDDGRPHVTPIWYDVDDDGALVFNTGERTVKGRNLIRDGRVALCVDDERPPFSFVSIEGTVEIIRDVAPAVGDSHRWALYGGGTRRGVRRAQRG